MVEADFIDRISIVGVDNARLRQTFSGAEQLFYSVMCSFARDYALAYEQLQSLVHNQELKVAKRYAHSVKGLCATLGVLQVADRFEVFEQALMAGDMTFVTSISDAEVAEFAQVVQAISQHCAERQSATEALKHPAETDRPWAEVKAELMALLEDYSGEVISYINQHQTQIKTVMGTSGLNELMNLADNFNYDEACALLAECEA